MTLIRDPAVLLYYVIAELLGGDGTQPGPKNQKRQKRQSYASFPVSFLLRKTNLCEWMKLSEGDFDKCISTVATLHGVDLKPLQTKVKCRVHPDLSTADLLSDFFDYLICATTETKIKQKAEKRELTGCRQVTQWSPWSHWKTMGLETRETRGSID